MELDVDAGGCEVAQLLFIHNLEQVLTFNIVKGDVEGRRQFLQKFEAIAWRQRRAKILRRFFGLCRLALEVESSDPARQMDQLRGGSPEQVRNCYRKDRHRVLDIIGRYVDRNWNLQFPNDRQTDRMYSAPAIVHSYNRGARRKPACSQSVQRISQRQNRIALSL